LVTSENTVLARVDPRLDFRIDNKARLAFNMDKSHLFDIVIELVIC